MSVFVTHDLEGQVKSNYVCIKCQRCIPLPSDVMVYIFLGRVSQALKFILTINPSLFYGLCESRIETNSFYFRDRHLTVYLLPISVFPAHILYLGRPGILTVAKVYWRAIFTFFFKPPSERMKLFAIDKHCGLCPLNSLHASRTLGTFNFKTVCTECASGHD